MMKGLVTDEAVRSTPAHVDAVICVLAPACRGNAQVWLHQAFAKSTGDAGSCGRNGCFIGKQFMLLLLRCRWDRNSSRLEYSISLCSCRRK